MLTGISVYKIKDFIRKDESGELSYQRSEEILKEIVTAAANHPEHNILLDFRNTTVADSSMTDILKIAMEVDKFKFILKNRVANVIPDESERIQHAKKVEAAFRLKGIQYKFFTDFEAAIEWLSDVVP